MMAVADTGTDDDTIAGFQGRRKQLFKLTQIYVVPLATDDMRNPLADFQSMTIRSRVCDQQPHPHLPLRMPSTTLRPSEYSAT